MSIFRNFFRFIKRAAIFFLILATISSIIYTVRIFRKGAKKISFSAIIDAGSANDVPELFAVARTLADPGFKVIGLTSSQWNYYPKAADSTARMSQELHDTLLTLFNMTGIPHISGGEESFGDNGQSLIRRSEAAEFIIEKAHGVSKHEKLNIIALGALTNIATAIYMDSTIVPKLKVYTLAMHYDPSTKVWNKNEPNARNDLDALDFLLNKDELELHIMPQSTAKKLIFNTEEIYDLMKSKGPQWEFLLEHWSEKSSGKDELIMSYVAFIEAILYPDFVKVEQAGTPPENYRRPVYIYTWINKEYMKIDYWKTIRNYISENKNKY